MPDMVRGALAEFTAAERKLENPLESVTATASDATAMVAVDAAWLDDDASTRADCKHECVCMCVCVCVCNALHWY